MKRSLLTSTIFTAAAITLSAGFAPEADASHFRGAALVPSVDANGLLTVTQTSFWANGSINTITPDVAGVGFMTQGATVQDLSDARFDKEVSIWTIQLGGAGTYDISTNSCCRIEGIQNGIGNTSVSWRMDSRIVWNGTTANAPILFNFSAIQPEVVRGSNYADGLGATPGNAGTLSYDQALNTNGGGAFNQTPGFIVNPTTGALTIPAVSTSILTDNPSNPGGDYLFSGNITNTDGSKVEFDWLFDAVDVGSQNLAPDVSDHVINALVGDNIVQVVTGTDNVDAISDDVLLSLLSFFGPGVNLAPSFVPGAAGDPTTGTFTWNTAGSAPGTYILNIQGTDGSLNDVGTVTINLSTGNGPTPTPEPATLSLLGLGLAGLGALVRHRRRRG